MRLWHRNVDFGWPRRPARLSRPNGLHSKRWWLWFGTLAFGITYFVAMMIFDYPEIHAARSLIYRFAVSLLGGCAWGYLMWKFQASKRK